MLAKTIPGVLRTRARDMDSLLDLALHFRAAPAARWAVRDVAKHAAAFSLGLGELGVQPGDTVVAAVAPESPDAPVAALGAFVPLSCAPRCIGGSHAGCIGARANFWGR